MFGGLGILEGSLRNWTCIPLSIRPHDGLQNASEWKGASISHVSQMVEDGYQNPGDSLLLLVIYFLIVPALENWDVLTGAALYG